MRRRSPCPRRAPSATPASGSCARRALQPDVSLGKKFPLGQQVCGLPRGVLQLPEPSELQSAGRDLQQPYYVRPDYEHHQSTAEYGVRVEVLLLSGFAHLSRIRETATGPRHSRGAGACRTVAVADGQIFLTRRERPCRMDARPTGDASALPRPIQSDWRVSHVLPDAGPRPPHRRVRRHRPRIRRDWHGQGVGRASRPLPRSRREFPSFRSTAARFRMRSSKTNCLGTTAAPTPMPASRRLGSSPKRLRERSFSTKSNRCRCARRWRCSGSSKTARIAASAAVATCTPTSASLPLRMPRSTSCATAAPYAAISSIASWSCRSPCRHSATAPATCNSWPLTLSIGSVSSTSRRRYA